jgi:hypothetical protein
LGDNVSVFEGACAEDDDGVKEFKGSLNEIGSCGYKIKGTL